MLVVYAMAKSSKPEARERARAGKLNRHNTIYENVMPKSSKPSEIFPDRLRAARERRELSQSELAERARLQASAVSHFETAGRKPSFENLKKLADALNVSTDYLLGRTAEMEGTAMAGDPLRRHYAGLSSEYQEMVDDFLEMLARKAKLNRKM